MTTAKGLAEKAAALLKLSSDAAKVSAESDATELTLTDVVSAVYHVGSALAYGQAAFLEFLERAAAERER